MYKRQAYNIIGKSAKSYEGKGTQEKPYRFLCTEKAYVTGEMCIRDRNHPEEVTYDCPQLEPILAPTYGCIVYQEQVMQIVRDLAGYTLGRLSLIHIFTSSVSDII